MSKRTHQTVRARVVGAMLLIMGAVLTMSVALVPDASSVSPAGATASAPTVGTSNVQLQSTATWANNNVGVVAVGDRYSCAVRQGVLYCWGTGADYRLGNNGTNDQPTPIKVSSNAEFTNNGTVSAVAPGFSHTCAIEGGVAHCWGREFTGALGLGATIQQTTPAKVSSTAEFLNNGNVTAIAAGQRHTCAIENGVVFCWGYNNSGQLGNASSSAQTVPVKVHAANGFANNGTVSALATGNDHTCAIEGTAPNAILYCWGENEFGALGNSATTDQQIPVKVHAASGFANTGNVTMVSTGLSHTCAVESGVAFCWGYNLDVGNPGQLSGIAQAGGQLGDGTNVSRTQPVKVLGADGMANNGTVSAIAAGLAHTCAMEGGVLYCWGSRTGRLGDGSTSGDRDRRTPIRVASNSAVTNAGVTSLSLGFYANHSCAVKSAVAFCWGSGSNGALGNGSSDSRNTPTLVFTPAPGAPSNLVASVGFGHISVAFTPGSGDITNYEYSLNLGSYIAANPPVTSSPLVITGLNNGTSYAIRLRAVGSGGSSSVAGPVTATPNALWQNTTATTVAGGGSHTCALAGGVAFCWGANGSGQLGDGSSSGATSARRVTPSGGLRNQGTVSAVATGGGHSCVIEGTSPNAVLYCWGSNTHGQLGDGTTTDRSSAVRVLPGGGFVNNGTVSAVSLGDTHTCALEGTVAGGDARVYCWGNQEFGRLGNGTDAAGNVTTPSLVLGAGGFSNNGNVSALGTGGQHSCALEGGTVFCWGANGSGQLGDGTTVAKSSPVQVLPGGGFLNGSTVSALATGGAHTCVIEGASPNAVAYCWGANGSGQLGDGTTTDRAAPVQVLPGGGFLNNGNASLLATGGEHSCVLAAGVAYCWGARLGISPAEAQTTPVIVPDGGGFTNTGLSTLTSGGGLAAADGISCVIKNGAVLCWGANHSGQLGTGNTVSQTAPSNMFTGTAPTAPTTPSITGIVRGFQQLQVNFTASTGTNVTYQYSTDAGLTWQTPNPTVSASPLVIPGLMNGTSYTVKLRGVNGGGFSNESAGMTASPTALWTTSTSATSISGGGAHTCALASGVVHCWGSALGSGTQAGVTQPTWVVPSGGMSNTGTVSAVATGGGHSCVIEGTSPNAVLYCWGSNTHGQLGDGTTTDRSSAVRVLPGGGFVNNGTVSAVSLGDTHTCALEGTVAGGDARVYCWGNQEFGRLGNGTDAAGNVTTPSLVLGAGGFSNNGNVSALGTGGQHSCALEGGTVFCWGANGSGQLGDGSTTTTSAAVQVLAGGGFVNNGTVSALALGGVHSCVLEGTSAGSDAALYCWGANASGQLGDGSTTLSTSPVRVLPGGGFVNNGTVSAMALGGAHSCALQGGIAYCWGAQLGTGTAQTSPVLVPGGQNSGLSTLTSGGGNASDGSACVIKNGAVACWGANGSGQLGDGTTTARTSPANVLGIDPLTTGQVVTAPTAPTITGITAGDTQLSVAFTAPSSDGGNAVSNYEYSINGGTTWVTRNPASTTSPWVITGLTNGTSYTVLLRAVNSAGGGTASSGSTATPTAGGQGQGNQGNQGNQNNQGGSGVPGAVNDLISAPATTVAPSVPAPDGPVVIAPPAPGTQPQLVTPQDAPTVQQDPGNGSVVVDGAPVEVQVSSLDFPSARVDPEDRTPAQVAAIQRAGAALIDDFNSLTPPGEAALVTLTNTPTGAVVNGVLVDPRDGETSVPVPVEDVLLVSAPQTKVLLAAASADAKPERVTRGVVTVRPSGVVAALAQGFDPSTPGEVVVFSTPTLLGTFTTDVNGTFTGQMTLPPDIQPGRHTLVLTTGTVTTSLGLLIDAEGNAEIVDPADPEAPTGGAGEPTAPIPGPTVLPATGRGGSATLLTVAALMMLLGAVALVRRRPGG